MPLHKSHMLNNLLRKFYRIVIMRIYTLDTVVLYEWKVTSFVETLMPIEIQRVTIGNVEDALVFQSKHQVDIFKKFLLQGDRGYYAYYKEQCIHRSWVVQQPKRISLHKFYEMTLNANEIFIQFCETAHNVRGKNIFARVLQVITKDFKEKKVLICVDEKNESSRKSVTKAGFKEIEHITIRMILGKKTVKHKLLAS